MSDAAAPDAPPDAPPAPDETGAGQDNPPDAEGADGQHRGGVNETERLYGVDENPS